MIPWEIFNEVVSDEVFELWNGRGATIYNEYFKKHGYGAVRGIKHSDYNTIVKKELKKYLGDKNLKDITVKEARGFLKLIQNMPNTSTVGAFNSAVRGQFRTAYRKALRDAAEEAAEATIREGERRGARKLLHKLKNVPVVEFVVIGVYWLIDAEEEGTTAATEQAIRDAAMPAVIDLGIDAAMYGGQYSVEAISDSDIGKLLIQRRMEMEKLLNGTDTDIGICGN